MAQDISDQRRNVASKAVDAATKFVDSLYDLLQLKDQRAKFVSDFVQSDFDNTSLKHLTPAQLGTLFDFVVPSLNTNFIDAANGNRNQQILQQVRGG